MGARDYSRAERVGDHIQRELAELVARDIDDPRIGVVTVSGVRLSKDLGHATVYVTPPQASDPNEVVAALNRASGYLRRLLAGRVRMRYVPRLRFAHDPTLDRATRIDSLLDSVGADSVTAAEPGSSEED